MSKLFHARSLVDGGLVNPIPISLCRALGADVVIAVDLTAQVYFQKPNSATEVSTDKAELSLPSDGLVGLVQDMVGRLRGNNEGEDPLPSMLVYCNVYLSRSRIPRLECVGFGEWLGAKAQD